MKAGTAATGTETSCLIEPPSGFCTSSEHVANAPERLGLIEIGGDAWRRSPGLARWRRRELFDIRRAGRSRLRRQFHQHVPGMFAGQRIADVVAVFEHGVDDAAASSVRTGDGAAEARLRQSSSSFTAASGDGTPIKAVSTARGCGNKFQHRRGDDAERAFGADKEMAQVVAGIVLFQLAQRCMMRPSASTTSTPTTSSRAMP